MDPLSGVSSIFAVISLAVELGKSVVEIKHFLDTIRNAPAEIIRLKGIISQILYLIEDINTLLESQKRSGCQNGRICDRTEHALKICQDKLDSINGIVHLADKANNGHRKISRDWARFRLACWREKIGECERQLDQSISILSTNLLLNLVDSNLTQSLELRSFTQQLLTYGRNVPTNHYYLCRSCGQQGNPETNLLTPTIPRLSKPSIHKEWSSDNRLHIQYYKLNGKRKKQSLLLQANIYGSYMVIVQLSRPFLGTSFSIPFYISIRNLIPANSAIVEACENGDSDGVRRLLDLGVARPNDTTPDNRTLLGVAIKGGHEEIVQLLLTAGANPNLPYGNLQISPLQIGIYFEKLNYYSTQGWSLLHCVFDGKKSMATTEYHSILRNYLSFEDVKDPMGWTSLHRCAAYGTAEDIYFLHQLGASALSNQYTTNGGWTPIHVAALMNNASTLKALYDLQTSQLSPEMVYTEDANDLNSVDFSGAVDTLQWLLRNGADPHRTTYRTANWFPEDLAMLSGKNCFDEFLETLREIGYDVTTDGDDVYWKSDKPDVSQ
ncbi:ankyrin [Annulohypoxylon moriforme]|nr:ankyrin [Annulohypoxylon moriforme]